MLGDFASLLHSSAIGIEKTTTMPGHKVFLQDDGEIFEGLMCSYCKLLLNDAVQTSESGQRLCKECFEAATRLISKHHTL